MNLMREERESRGITQQEVADKLGLTGSSLAKWERAARRVDVIDLRDYLQAIGVDLAEFVTRWNKLADDLDAAGSVDVKLRTRARHQVGPDDRLK